MDNTEKKYWEQVKEVIKDRKNDVVKQQSYERAGALRTIERYIIEIINEQTKPEMIVSFFKEEMNDNRMSKEYIEEINKQHDIIVPFLRRGKLKDLLD